MSEFNAQELANSAWALATASQLDEKLLMALAKAAQRRMTEFKHQSLANTAWAFAAMIRPDEKLLTALMRAA